MASFIKRIDFNNRNELVECPNKELIEKIVYHSDEPLLVGDLPNGGALKEITFKNDFIVNPLSIPYGVEKITYTTTYRPPYFDTLLNGLPESATIVKNVYFQSNDDDTKLFIPNSIKSIKFDKHFLKSIDTIQLTPFIKSLKFVHHWDNAGKEFSFTYIPSIENCNLNELHIGNIKLSSVPQSITSLSISSIEQITQYPPNLLKLKSWSFGLSIDSISRIPHTVKSLKIGSIPSQIKIGMLPNSLQKLKVYMDTDLDENLFEEGSLPTTLTHFKIKSMMYWKGYCGGWNQTISSSFFPSSLVSLHTGDAFNQSLNSIKHLSSLTSLTLGTEFTQPILINQLPSSLKKLKFICQGYDTKLGSTIFPPSLTLLVMPKYMLRKQLITHEMLPSSTILKLKGWPSIQ